MKKYFLCLLTFTFLIFNYHYTFGQGSCADGSYQWSDINAILVAGNCNSCHGGASMQGGWNFDTYAGAIAAGNCGVANVVSGNALGSLLFDKVDGDGTVACGNAMPNGAPPTAAAFSAADLAAIENWINAGAFENCRGVPEDDGLCMPTSTIGALNAPAETSICSDGSNVPTFTTPTTSLPDVEVAVEVNGTLVEISADGTFDASTLVIGDEVCYTAFGFDLAGINTLLEDANNICAILDCDLVFGIPGVTMAITDLINGVNDGNPGLNDLNEALAFAGSFGSPIQSVQSAVGTLNSLNETIGAFNLGPVCFATSNNVCLLVEQCVNTCPTVILNDNNLPTLPPAVCTDDLLSLCFDVNVDEATFDPSLVQFNYNLSIDGVPSAVTLNNSYVSGGGIDPNATGQLCFETNVPAGTDPCAPYQLSLEIIDVFYLDTDCPNNFVAYDLNITTPVVIMQTGDNLNDLVPILTLGGLNPILVQIFPNPNWTANVIQVPACDGSTLGTIEILAADGTTVCETLTNVGTAGMDGCPVVDAVLPETLYENYTTYLDADMVEQPNPCAISITLPEQVISCEDQCIICPAVVNVIPPDNICPDAGSVTFCVEFDMIVDASTVLTVEGLSMDGAAGGTQICVDVPFTAPFDPCNGAAFDYTATAICDGNDLLDGLVWLSSQILPITDPTCGGIAGCTDNTACNYNPNAVCDDPNDPCLPAPTCNTDPCAGDIEIIDPADACNCIVDEPQVLGCTDVTACNYSVNANCEDNSCDFGNVNCADPCNPVSGCTDATACNFDMNACIDDGSCQAPPCNPGCTDPCADNYDPNADEDNGTCNPYDDTCNADCSLGDFGGTWDAITCACINEITPVNGCTDATACNYNANANCDDSTCDFGDVNCADPCNPVSGCTDATACNFDMNACIDDGSCQASPCNPGCTDPCADNYDPNADEDNGTCNPYDDTCNADCSLGDFGGTWDATTCACINEITPVSGCTDATANNYDSAANCDDGSCVFDMCDDPCAPNFGAAEVCEFYDDTCNADCNTGPFGGIWDAASCSCINETTPVDGCTDPIAANYDPAANCDDGSCIDVCEEEINGAIVVSDPTCNVGGIDITILAPDGTSITVTTNADGTFSVPGGPYQCGDYTAAFTDVSSLPTCYSTTGSIDPILFTVDGEGGGDDGPFFFSNPVVPTLSQWSLISLALLLMIFGALKLSPTIFRIKYS